MHEGKGEGRGGEMQKGGKSNAVSLGAGLGEKKRADLVNRQWAERKRDAKS